jgi:single-strand DNA-binding protein
VTVNKVILVGRLGRDPEGRSTTGGSKVVNLSLATEESWTDQRGERQKKTEWHRVSVFGKPADNCEQYLAKGSLIYVEGRIQTREWQDKTGAKRTTSEVVASVVKFLDRQGGGRGDGQGAAGGGGYDGPPDGDDDVPF